MSRFWIITFLRFSTVSLHFILLSHFISVHHFIPSVCPINNLYCLPVSQSHSEGHLCLSKSYATNHCVGKWVSLTHTLMISVSMATESAASLLRCRSDRGVCNSSSIIFIPPVCLSACLSALTSSVLVVYNLCEKNTTFLYQTIILKRLGGKTGALIRSSFQKFLFSWSSNCTIQAHVWHHWSLKHPDTLTSRCSAKTLYNV